MTGRTSARAASARAARILLSSSLVALALAGSAAAAQEAAPPATAQETTPPAAEDSGLAVADIIVTAQKRAQNLQDVPISIAVVTGEAITDQNFRSLQDLSRTQPAFSAAPSGRGVRMSLRGISSGTNAAFDQSVVTFVDDVYRGKARSSGALLLDIDRIELLKGPQTTFFGNNAIAGAINVQTVRPKQDFGGSVRALYGADGEYAAEAIVNVPVSDTLAIRAAGLANGLDGYILDRTGDGKLPRERNAAGRVSAQWDPTETFSLFLKAEATRNRNRGGSGAQLVDCPPPAPFVPGPFCPAAIAAGADTVLNYVRDQNAGSKFNLDTEDYQGNASLDLGGATLTSVTAYSRFTFVGTQDVDSTPTAFVGLRNPQRFTQFSQELRLASNDGGAPLSYIVGGYYQTSRFRDVTELTYSSLTPVINSTPAFAGLRGSLPFGQITDVLQKEELLSGFASLTWRPAEALAITAGARYSRVEKSINQLVTYGQAADIFGNITPYTGATATLGAAFANARALGVPGTRDIRRVDDRFTPTVNVQYELAPTVNLYASYSKGFKAGGFNGTLVTGTTSDIPFGPEYVTAYEAGLRSELFDRRLLFNVTAFRSSYRNLQVSIFTPINGASISVVQNAASSVSQGVELESRLAITRSLSVGSSMTFLDSHFKDFPNASPTAAQRALQGRTAQDLSGAPTAYAPKYSATFYASYKHALTRTLDLAVDANLLHQSRYYTTDQIDRRLSQGTYNKIDGRIAISTNDDAWEFSVIGKNLTNKLIIAAGTDASAAGTYSFVVERPRSVVFQLRHKF